MEVKTDKKINDNGSYTITTEKTTTGADGFVQESEHGLWCLELWHSWMQRKILTKWRENWKKNSQRSKAMGIINNHLSYLGRYIIISM